MKLNDTLVGLVVLLSLLGSPVLAESSASAGVRGHVEFLADPALEGRLTGTPGAAAAASYLARRLEELGAIPLPGQEDFTLEFEFMAGTNDAGSSLALRTTDDPADAPEPSPWTGTDDVQALSFSATGVVSGPVVFAGYGLSLPEDEEQGYDSFIGLDVEDKIVLVLRYVPEGMEQEDRARLARYSGLRYKALHARELGARAIILVTGPRSPNAGETIPMFFDTALSGSGIVAASISGRVADRIFEFVEERTLEQAQQALDGGNPHVTGFEIPGIELTLDVRVERERKTAANVVGLFPARPADSAISLDSGYVVLGAHVDHLGHGNHGNSLARKEEQGQVHCGADDNASGVAAVLEAVARLRAEPRPRPLILGFWSGKELGLLGSSEFIKSEVVSPESIHAYVNFDMVGRMRDNKLSLQAVGSSSVWPRLIEQTNVVAGFDVSTQDDPYLPTDATTFYQAGVPTINFFTGSHEDYHRPTDTVERVNYEDLERIVEFAASLTTRLSRLPERPDYLTVATKRDDVGGRDAMRAFTGTIPDYTTEVDGLRLSGVVAEGPADVAGLAEGDVIVEFAGQKISNIYDYTYALEAVKIGEPVRVVFRREGQRHEVTITPTSRK